MVITNQNRVFTSNNGTRICVNDAINFFFGSIDNNWSNPLNWSLGIVPTNSHVAYIMADCVLSATGANTVKGLVVTTGSTLTMSTTYTFTILTNLEVYGSMYYANTLILQSSVTSFLNTGVFAYTRDASLQQFSVQGSLTLPPNLVLPTLISSQSTITQSGDLTVMGDYMPNNSIIDAGAYNLTIMGVSNVNAGGFKKQSGTGKVVLNGKITAASGRFFNIINGNPTIEIRGGMDLQPLPSYALGFSNANDCTMLFTRNQTISIAAGATLTCTNFLIADGVTVTINDANTTPVTAGTQSLVNGLLVKGKLDGTTGSSTLIYNTSAAQAPIFNGAYGPMQTAGSFVLNNSDGNRNLGLFNSPDSSASVHTAWGNSFDYLYVTSQALNITGTGTVLSFTQPLTVNKGLDIRAFGKLDMGSNNLTVWGTTYLYYTSSGTSYTSLQGSGTANWLFAQQCTFGRRAVWLPGANINIEFRGGITTEDITTTGSFTMDFGLGTIKATTNDQTWNVGGVRTTINNLLVDRNISLSLVSTQFGVNNTASGWFAITGSMEGADATSKIICKGYTLFQTAVAPMNTGMLDVSSFANVFSYSYIGAATIKGFTYYHLYISSSTSGTVYNKTLTSDLVVLGDMRLASAQATLLATTYAITVYGNTTFTGQLNKTGGSMLLMGLVSIAGSPALSSNVTVECRGGFTFTGTAGGTWGQYWKFTTTNQTLTSNVNAIPLPVLVDSGITLTVATALTNSGSINGVDATAKLINTGTLDFRAAGTIMATGKLYCDTVLNTVIYNTTLAQTIAIPADSNYRNLTLSSTSTKTVASPGTVNVRGTYTKGATTTVVGTITNNP